MPFPGSCVEQESQNLIARGANSNYGVRNTRQNNNPTNLPRTFANDKDEQLTFYPAYCHKVSPTSFTWVKLTAWQIRHDLKVHKDFQTTSEYDLNGYNRNPPLLLFYLNHPIQFVQVIGVVVSFEDYFEKFWLFTIDDGSNATIDVTCRKPDIEASRSQTADARKEGNGPTKTKKAEDADETKLQNILSSSQISIGTVIRAKGTLTTFRSNRQITLHRLDIVQSTSAEVSLIDARTKFLRDVLSKPWTVDQNTQGKLRKQARGEASEESERRKRRKLREKRRQLQEQKHTKQIHEDYENEETQRKQESDHARQAGEAWNKQRLSHPASAIVTELKSEIQETIAPLDEKQKLLREAFG